MLADLLDKVVGHLSSTECFFTKAQYKGQWWRGICLLFVLTIRSRKNNSKGQSVDQWNKPLSSFPGLPQPKRSAVSANWTLTLKLLGVQSWRPKVEQKIYSSICFYVVYSRVTLYVGHITVNGSWAVNIIQILCRWMLEERIFQESNRASEGIGYLMLQNLKQISVCINIFDLNMNQVQNFKVSLWCFHWDSWISRCSYISRSGLDCCSLGEILC